MTNTRRFNWLSLCAYTFDSKTHVFEKARFLIPMLTLAFVVAGSAASHAVPVPVSLNIDNGLSSVTANMTLTADVPLFGTRSDSDSDTSSLSGTVDLDLNADFSTGQMVVDGVTVTDAAFTVDDGMDFHFVLVAFVAEIDLNGANLAGTITTPAPPSVIAPDAQHGELGLFDASDHNFSVNQGTFTISGASSGTIDLAATPLDGSGSTVEAGVLDITRTATNPGAYTTTYSIEFELPLDFTDSFTPTGATADADVLGQVIAINSAFELEFLPTNGIVGDVNQDGFVTEADVTAFVAGWRTSGHRLGLEAYTNGDLNFDGTTDLFDAVILHDALLKAGVAYSRLSSLSVPEPGSLALLISMAAMVAWVSRRWKGRQ